MPSSVLQHLFQPFQEDVRFLLAKAERGQQVYDVRTAYSSEHVLLFQQLCAQFLVQQSVHLQQKYLALVPSDAH